jgi:hypothetical protein
MSDKHIVKKSNGKRFLSATVYMLQSNWPLLRDWLYVAFDSYVKFFASYVEYISLL